MSAQDIRWIQRFNSRMKCGLRESVIEKICAVLARHPQVEKAIL